MRNPTQPASGKDLSRDLRGLPDQPRPRGLPDQPSPQPRPRGLPDQPLATGLLGLAVLLGCAANIHGLPDQSPPPRVVDYRPLRWSTAAGGDGALRTLVVVEQSWSWHDANALALQFGATLSRADSPSELTFLELLSDHPSAFDCGGPWLGGFREPQGAWLWGNGLPVQSFGWKPFRPAQSILFESALMMSGIDGPDGRWLDAFTDPDAGVTTRAAIYTWATFLDCDSDDRPDVLEIALDPALDANGDGRLDSCNPANPADVNGDGRVDASDLAAVLNAWGSAAGAADIDGDGAVGATDLTLLLNAWTG
ncbi:MAG: Dockerin type domain [Planctomycetota bacterium]